MLNLPRTKFADTNGVWRQFFHLVSEVWEVFVALIVWQWNKVFNPMDILIQWRSNKHVGRELVDVQISAHTLRHIFDNYYGADMKTCEDYVYSKGIERGYYQQVPNSPCQEADPYFDYCRENIGTVLKPNSPQE